MINTLALKKLNEFLGSHESFHRLHEGRAQPGKLLDDFRVPESPVTYVSMEIDDQYAITWNCR